MRTHASRSFRLLAPRSWPIAVRISVDLVLAATLPLILAVALTLTNSNRELREAAKTNLQLLAGQTATRLDQLIVDTRRMATQISREDVVARLCMAEGEIDESLREEVERKLHLVVSTNPDFGSMFVTSAEGIGIAATREENMGMDLNFREYYQEARQGKTHVSEILVGKTSIRPGVYFSAPVRRPGTDHEHANVSADDVIGVVVLKLEGERIWDIVDSVQVGARGYAVLTNQDAVVLAHPDKNLLYHSLGHLPPESQAVHEAQLLWSVERVPSLGLETFARLVRESPSGSVEFVASSTLSHFSDGAMEIEGWVAGFAPLREREWRVSVIEPISQFAAPISALVREQAMIVILVALLAGGLAIVRARGLVRPVLAVTSAAERLAGGDFSARAPIMSEDEIGRLAKTFNEMVLKLHDHVQLQQSLEVAMEVQKSLLPARDPAHPRLDIAGHSRYCDATGGDYYDFIDVTPHDDDSAVIALGDVMGHGIAAALLMASARAALRASALDPGTLAEHMTRVNKVLASDARHKRFMTMALVHIAPLHGAVRWASAGHDPTLILRRDAKHFVELEGGDVPLGIMEDVSYAEYHFDDLRQGDVLVIGTDGIWEMRDHSNEFFGKERLRDVVRRHMDEPAAVIAEAINDALDAFRGECAAQDDITFVIVKVR